MYTSGTTDRPKGVMHSYGNFYWKCLDHITALGLGGRPAAGGGPAVPRRRLRPAGLAVLLVGGTLVVQRDFDPKTRWR
jgi:fatty-acyl-CoA synthase